MESRWRRLDLRAPLVCGTCDTAAYLRRRWGCISHPSYLSLGIRWFATGTYTAHVDYLACAFPGFDGHSGASLASRPSLSPRRGGSPRVSGWYMDEV